MRFRRKKHESYDEMRKRLIAETELALLYGLRFPERTKRIPRLISGTGTFHPSISVRFWAEALGMEESEVAQLNQPPPIETLPGVRSD
jgi:hypothetical protein